MWQKLIGKQYGFFELFNRHAATTMEGAKALLALCDEFPEIAGRARRIEELERECDSIAHMTIDLLRRSFVTPLDRDEILELITTMDNVMDFIESAAKRMLLFELKGLPDKLKEMIKVLNRAQEQVIAAVGLIPGFKYEDKLREILKEIHSLENEGDGLHYAGISELFHNNADNPLLVIKEKEIYETVEKAIDECEDIAEIVESIILEHF